MSKGSWSVKIRIIAILLLFCLFGIFFFLSVLGENDKAKVVVENFFEQTRDKNYLDAEKFYSKTSTQRFGSFDDSMKFHFILELALLRHFELIGEQEYKVKVERENFWLPIFGSDEISLGVELFPKSKVPFFSLEGKGILHNFITVIRENGAWKIKSINTGSSVIKSSLENIREEIDLNKYVELYDKGFLLKRINVNTNKLGELEKKIIIHSLETAIEKLHISEKPNKHK